MLQKIPEDQYKAIKIDDTTVSAYKSQSVRYNKNFKDFKIDPEACSLSFKAGNFRLDIYGKKNLEYIKELIEFAIKNDK